MEGAGGTTKIEYFHASKYGNGAQVAEEFQKQMAARGVAVTVRPIRDVRPREMPPADLYVFSSPGRLGKPTWGMRRFLKKVKLPAGTRYALLTTEMPTPEERREWQRVIPIMNQMLQEKGLVKVAESEVLVTAIKGPLQEDWQKKVQAFASQVLMSLDSQLR
ncbi:MAG: flavodoxin family protein [Sedimentisphaerales bacterium]|nr:flavodoxin family protein [Sedimentisphaerales bacterium]